MTVDKNKLILKMYLAYLTYTRTICPQHDWTFDLFDQAHRLIVCDTIEDDLLSSIGTYTEIEYRTIKSKYENLEGLLSPDSFFKMSIRKVKIDMITDGRGSEQTI